VGGGKKGKKVQSTKFLSLERRGGSRRGTTNFYYNPGGSGERTREKGKENDYFSSLWGRERIGR